MGLFDIFKPKHQHSDPNVRCRAVASITDETILSEIAGTDDSARVRMAAVERITSENVLADVARDAAETDARVAAVQRIGSQHLLAEIIKSRRNLDLMGACFARITDRDLLAQIARDTGYNITARRIAFENFADESFLSDVADEIHPPDTPSEPKSEEEVTEMLEHYGGMRVVRAIGKFRGSEKALRALGVVARKGGDCGELAMEYLVRALVYSNETIRNCAVEELATLSHPEQVGVLVRQLDNTNLREPVEQVLARIDTPEARAALGNDVA